MIELLITLLLALQAGTACDLGTPVDWYAWANTHEQADVVLTVQAVLPRDAWLYHDAASDTYLLFVFRERISDVTAAGRYDPHGACAVEVTP